MQYNSKNYLIIAVLLIAVLSPPFISFGASGVPQIINYQGSLLNSDGDSLGGENGTDFCFKFSFYDDTTVGSPDNQIWPDSAPSTMTVFVEDGVFDVGIGDVSQNGDLLDFDFQSTDTIFLDVQVASKSGATCNPGDGAESFETLSPRKRIFSSGYSINSSTVSGFEAHQSASGSQVPVLTSGNLILGGTNPQVNSTLTNSLIVQGSSTSGNTLLNTFSGFAGIGVSNPSAKLHVGGEVIFDPSVGGSIEFGTQDAFSRTQIWNYAPDAILRLGSLQADGDPTNSSSEGIVVYSNNFQGDPFSSSEFGYARVKSDRFSLYNSQGSGFIGNIFRIDLSENAFFLTDNDGNKTFEFDRLTGTLAIDSAIGVGTTAPGARVHAIGSETTANGSDAGIRISNIASGGGNWTIRTGATGTNTPPGGFSIGDDGDYRFVISPSGNVGIGTLDPQAKLEISSAGTVGLQLNSGVGNNAFIRFAEDGNAVWDVARIGSDNRIFVYDFANGGGSDAEVFTILKGGNIGIGTTSPNTLFEVSGTASAASIFGAGLEDCDSSSSKLLWDESTGLFSCGVDAGIASIFDVYDNAGGQTFTTPITVNLDTIRKNHANYSLASDVVTVNSNGLYEITFACSADGTTGSRTTGRCWLEVDTGAGFAEIDGSRCYLYNRNSANGDSSCGRTIVRTLNNGDDLRLRIERLNGNTLSTIADGSSMTVAKIVESGADLAEIYYTKDSELSSGHIVGIDVSISAGVKRSNRKYDPYTIGVISTNPGHILSEEIDQPEGRPVLVALSGRVPVKVSNENGPIKAGDPLTSSSVPGIAMKADKSGRVIGLALEDYTEGRTENINGEQVFDEIIVFISLDGYVAEDLEEGHIFDLNILFNSIVKKFEKTFDIVFERGLLKISNIVTSTLKTDKIETKSIISENGLTTYDAETGEFYCIKVSGGTIQSFSGKCSDANIKFIPEEIIEDEVPPEIIEDDSLGEEIVKPEASVSPKPEEVSPAPEPTPTPEITPTPEPTPEITPTPTPAPTPEPELNEEQDNEDT